MKNKRLLSPKEAAQELGVSTKTIHRWDAAGNLQAVRTVGNQQRIPIEEVHRLRRQSMQRADWCVIYARVPSVRHEQDGHLARQTERLREVAKSRGYEVVEIITQHTSSINELSPGVKKLLTVVESQAVDAVLGEYPDRLVRFGFGYLEQAFGWKSARLEVLEHPTAQEPPAQLIQDLLTMVTVEASRLSGSTLAKGLRQQVETARKRVGAG